MMHCHLHRGDWSLHLTNKKKNYHTMTSGSNIMPRMIIMVPLIVMIMMKMIQCVIMLTLISHYHFYINNSNNKRNSSGLHASS